MHSCIQRKKLLTYYPVTSIIKRNIRKGCDILMYKDATAFKHTKIDEMNEEILATVRRKKDSARELPAKGRMPSVVSCPGLAGVAIGFRECAALIKTAQETGCSIRLAANGQSGQADSMLDLLKMHIDKGTFVMLTITGGKLEEALPRCRDIMAFA